LQFQNRWINPYHQELQKIALGITERVGPRATLGILIEDKEMLAQGYPDFYASHPTVIYLSESSSIWKAPFLNANSPNARTFSVNKQGQLVFGDPSPDYLFTTLQLPEPLKLMASFSTSNGNQAFFYQIPRE